MKNSVPRHECINANFIIDNGFQQPRDQSLFGPEHVEMVGANCDMYDLLVKARLFSSKTEARNNWKRTGKNIPWGWTHIKDIGKARSQIAILRPLPNCKKWILEYDEQDTEMVFVVSYKGDKAVVWEIIKNGEEWDCILKMDDGSEVVLPLSSLENKGQWQTLPVPAVNAEKDLVNLPKDP